ncbi:hypothetical protein PGIGA_G00232780 [Pangasianodon gigas]|uniref:Uncharacterized protein n=1 Tax=Pangasianodon gigas TaxID=30993 RepID=A0ACC5WL79_PANGG|nr:hypothetical protein [Pangasianodon gigas]
MGRPWFRLTECGWHCACARRAPDGDVERRAREFTSDVPLFQPSRAGAGDERYPAGVRNDEDLGDALKSGSGASSAASNHMRAASSMSSPFRHYCGVDVNERSLQL